MKRISAALGGLVIGLSTAMSASAAPVQWSGNGHYYEFISTSTSWTSARSAALASTFNSLTGYLATVTSAAENSFLQTLAVDGWLGGSDAAVEGDWRWVDGAEAGQLFWQGGPGGTAFGYASWNNGEPNNSGDEDYLHLNFGRWNDLPNGSSRGYFVEYSEATVPTPGTLSLSGLALAAALALRQRRARKA